MKGGTVNRILLGGAPGSISHVPPSLPPATSKDVSTPPPHPPLLPSLALADTFYKEVSLRALSWAITWLPGFRGAKGRSTGPGTGPAWPPPSVLAPWGSVRLLWVGPSRKIPVIWKQKEELSVLPLGWVRERLLGKKTLWV